MYGVCVLLCFITVPGLHRERAKGDTPTIRDRRRPNLNLSPSFFPFWFGIHTAPYIVLT